MSATTIKGASMIEHDARDSALMTLALACAGLTD